MWTSRTSFIWYVSSSLLLLLVALPLTAVAQYRIESWTIDNGLPQNTVRSFTCLYEDKDGTLLAGSEGGVTRYHDGVFTSYPLKGQVFEFRHDFNGELIISTDAGQFYFREGTFILAPPEYQEEYKRLYPAPSGAQWTITANKVQEVNNGRVTDYPVRLLLGDEVYPILQTRDDDIWIGSTAGLSRFHDGRRLVTRPSRTRAIACLLSTT